jgi:hypothetical protein
VPSPTISSGIHGYRQRGPDRVGLAADLRLRPEANYSRGDPLALQVRDSRLSLAAVLLMHLAARTERSHPSIAVLRALRGI